MARKPSTQPQQSLFAADDPTAVPADAATPPGWDGCDPGWTAALAPQFAQPYFAALTAFVAGERAAHPVFPPERDVFNAFRYTPLADVRVVLLGQDPYPTEGQAHGLCFSVRPGVTIPGSLRNMYKELQADLGVPPAKHGHLVHWAKQGVLMLNACLTVRGGAPNSHKDRGWERFTDAALAAVNARPEPAVFILWGAYAQKKLKLIDAARHAVVQSAHPSPLSAKSGFFGSKPFSQVNAALTRFGRPPVDWQLPPVAVEE